MCKDSLYTVEITANARKRGFTDDELLHAWENAIGWSEHFHDGEDRWLVIGPLPSGALLELVVVPFDGPSRIIHANHLQANHLHYLRGLR